MAYLLGRYKDEMRDNAYEVLLLSYYFNIIIGGCGLYWGIASLRVSMRGSEPMESSMKYPYLDSDTPFLFQIRKNIAIWRQHGQIWNPSS